MRLAIPRARRHELISRLRFWSSPLKVLAGVPMLACGCLSALADDSTGAFHNRGVHALGVQSCAGVLSEGSEDDFAIAADCLGSQWFSGLFDVTFKVMEEHGDALFGEHFHLDHRLDFSASGGGIGGDLDVVIPLNSFTSMAGDGTARALFVQNGEPYSSRTG